MPTSNDDTKSVEESLDSWIVERPSEILLELPVRYRWEFTRRHPYYLRFWKPAHQRRTAPSNDATQRGLEEAAALILTLIGVSTDPPSPSVTSDKLEDMPLKKAWTDGAVAPVTFRGTAVMLLAGLPADALAMLGKMLTACDIENDESREWRYRVIDELMHLSHPALDAVAKGPVLGINIHAPANAILEAIEDLVKQWKIEAGIPEHRRRDDKLPDYLEVWDLREGWVGDHYDSREERTFNQIAQQLSLPVSTIGNRYRSAFWYIVGHDFTPELWARVIGFLKLQDWIDPSKLPIRTLRRRWRTPSPNPAPESRMQPSGGQSTVERFLNTAGISRAEIAMADLQLDVRLLIEEGLTNDQICTKLELQPDQVNDMIDYVRTRHDDGL